MRLLSARLIISLVIGVTLVSLCSSYYQSYMLAQGMRRDLEHRAQLLGESLASNVERDMERSNPGILRRTVQQFANREHLAGLAVYDPQGKTLAVATNLQTLIESAPAVVVQSLKEQREIGGFVRIGIASLHIYAVPLRKGEEVTGSLAIVHDSGYIKGESLRIWRETFLSALAHVFIIVLLTLVIVRWSIAGPIARTAHWMKALRTGRAVARIKAHDLDLFRPLAREVATFAESLHTARSAAELEARLRESGESTWTADRLAVHIRARLEDSRLFVVSNREPYIHLRRGKSIEVSQPASGLVTALEPVLQACGGTWVAHGSGDGDIDAVDVHDRLPVPPDDPHYTLRRIWLSKEEEQGYYYGFSNEGLWPLCHIAHTRPLFRADDWKHYQEVNRKFADALLEEMADTKHPVVLVQDYHFALLPRMIKEQRPEARVAIFWHIPWPNPEAFGICPWQRELVDGLLGADLIGFHIQSHCTNFLQTVDRTIESRIDWDHSTVQRLDHRTAVRPFPISVECTELPVEVPRESAYEERGRLLKSLGVEAALMGVGVDRMDYTKGILERFLAIERFLEKYPRYQGVFTFVQIGAPSRTHIKRYHDLQAELVAEADRINWRFQADQWKPILLLNRQHSHKEVAAYYRAADLCLVTSLHDGMNLVAKEFVATRRDERGVLILSCFTGAARELRDALQVNPYDIDQTADAIRAALEMPSEEKEIRMHRMRKTVREHNVYRWAGNLIAELCEVRLDDQAASPAGLGRALISEGGVRDVTTEY
ncbi:MAG: trehalose-6-phosphate synthase [Candidatus Sulfotelmatobacter sp.]|jgi:alpha,alpha-trehalose-phosphate synthase [UDP-forming]